MSWPWSELGLSGPANLAQIRHAYAQRLKETHPEEDPEGFQRLHGAYRQACRLAKGAEGKGPSGPRGQNGKAPRFGPSQPEPGPEEEKADWDYDELLRREGIRPRPEPEPEEKKADWDYDELLSREEPRPRPEPEPEEPEKDWDFERLFAEGEAQQAEALRRRIQANREKNQERYRAQERRQRAQARAKEEAWAAVMAALHALDLLWESGSSVLEWKRFCASPVFQRARREPDFVFGLEDFLEQHPNLSPEIRLTLFLAYGFESGQVNPFYQRLHVLLSPQRRGSGKAEGPRLSRKRGLNTVVIQLAVVCAALLAVWWVKPRPEPKQPEQPWQKQVCAWLEEDFGRPFRYFWEEGAHDNAFAPEDEPDFLFLADLEGERDLEQGKPGYGTNYTERLMMRAVEEFAGEWGYDISYDSAHGFVPGYGSSPGAFLLDLPLTGAEEGIAALGERIEQLKREDWYQKLLPEFELMLRFKGLTFYSYLSFREEFDPEYAVSLYHTNLGPNVCRYLVEECGLAGEGCTVIPRGTVDAEGEHFFWASGMRDNVEEEHFLLADSGILLFCLSDEQFQELKVLEDLYQGKLTVETAEEIQFNFTFWDRRGLP